MTINMTIALGNVRVESLVTDHCWQGALQTPFHPGPDIQNEDLKVKPCVHCALQQLVLSH